jgi:hypothetical protein
MNNPEALVVIALGMLLMVLGFKNKADNLIAAATGNAYGNSTLQ